MKRFFGELGVLMRKRRHLLFLIIVWSVIAVTLFAFGKGLDATTEGAFGTNEEGVREYKYELDSSNTQVVSSDSLILRKKLNKLLSESDEYGFYAFLDTTGTVTSLNSKNLAVAQSSGGGTMSNGAEGEEAAQNYTVQVLFIDKNTAARAGFSDAALKLFDEDLDYDAVIPAIFGSSWMSEMSKLAGNEDYIISTSLADFKVKVGTMLMGSGGGSTEDLNKITLAGKEIDLRNYVVLPLREQGSSNSVNEGANDTDRKTYWCNVYDIRNNQGIITSDMKPDSLQKRMNELLEKNDLADSYTIRIQDADYDNKILFQENLDTIKLVVKDVALGALAIACMMLLLYILFSITKNQRYGFIAHINGTGKLEFWLLHMFQLLIFFIFTAAPAYGLYFGLMRLMNISYVENSTFIIPAALIAGVSAFAVTIRIIFWDTGKILRRV